jgi:hypothetical protein
MWNEELLRLKGKGEARIGCGGHSPPASWWASAAASSKEIERAEQTKATARAVAL